MIEWSWELKWVQRQWREKKRKVSRGGDRGPVSIWMRIRIRFWSQAYCRPHYKLFLVMARIMLSRTFDAVPFSASWRRKGVDFLFWPGSLNSVHTAAVVGSVHGLSFGRLLSALSLAVNHNLTRFLTGLLLGWWWGELIFFVLILPVQNGSEYLSVWSGSALHPLRCPQKITN